MHRLFRLLIAVALVGLVLAQAGGSVDAAPAFVAAAHKADPHGGQGHFHGATADRVADASAHPAPVQHNHSDQACIKACCIVLSDWTQPALAGARVYFASAVLYGQLTQARFGQSFPPEPDVPKNVT